MKKFVLVVALCLALVSNTLGKVEDPVEKVETDQAAPEEANVTQEEAAEKKEEAEEKVAEAKQEVKQAEEEEKKAVAEETGAKPEAEAEAEAEAETPEEGAKGEGETKEEEEKEEEARPRPMSPAKDYPANQNLPPASRPKYRCELCMMVLGRKLQNQNLCDGLEHKADIETCRETVETLTLYDRYIVDWLYGDGCQRTAHGGWHNVKPCPSHVICSWMIRQFNDGNRRTFCQFEDPLYRRSPAFHAKHHIATKEVEEEEGEPVKVEDDNKAEKSKAEETS